MTNTIAAVILALALQEGRGKLDHKANGKAGEVGSLQIQQRMLDDHYRRTKVRFTLGQARTWGVATNVATAYLAHYGKGRWTPEQCAVGWNAGPDLIPRSADYVNGFKRYHAWVLRFESVNGAYTNALARRVSLKSL